MKKCYLSIIILLSLNVQAEHVFKTNPKSYQGSLVVDPYFTESDFIFKEYNPLPWTELERNLSNFTPLILNQTSDFIQNGTATILQERTIQHVYTNTKVNTDVVRQTSKEQQTIIEPTTQNVIVTKTNSIETENKSNCTEWTPATDTKFTDEMIEQTQECDVQTVDTYSYSINGNIVEQKDLNGSINKTFEQEVEGTKPLIFASCKEIFDAGRSNGNGNYTLNVNGNTKNVYCDMNDGGWTLLYSFGNSNKSALIKTNMQTSTDINSENNVYINANEISNTYHNSAQHNIPNDYLSFFISVEPIGYLNINSQSYSNLKIEYGNGFWYEFGTCQLSINGNLIESLSALQHNTKILNNVSNSSTIQISEHNTSICIIRDVYFK